MRKLWKVLIGLLALALLLVIALVVIVNVLITPERVKQAVLPVAEEALQRRVEIGLIEISLFSGIALHDLKVFEKEGEELFVGADLVRLQYQLLPLLAMQVVIDEVRLERPEIRVVRLADGRFNFSDLLEPPAPRQPQSPSAPKSPSEPASVPPEPPSAESASLSLLVSQVRLEDGRLLFLDYAVNDRAPYRYEITRLRAAADGITLTGTVPVRVRCQLNGSELAIDGRVNLAKPGGTFNLLLNDLDVLAFQPYYAAELPGKLTGLKLTLEMDVDGGTDRMAAKGRLTGSNLGLLLDALPEAPIEKGEVRFDYDLQVDLEAGRLDLRRFNADYNGLVIEAAGRLSDLFAEPVADVTVTIPDLELRQAISGLPRGLIKDIAELDPAGSISGNAVLAGPLADPVRLLQSARIVLDNVQATTGGLRPSLSGQLDLTGDQLASKGLTLRMGDNSADIVLMARRLFTPPLQIRADISSQRFLLDPLLQASAGTAAAGSAAATGQLPESSGAAGDELGPFDLPVQANGSLRIAETVWKGLKVNDFLANYALKDNVLIIERLEGKVAGGSFASRANVDLGKKGLVYQADFSLQAIQADPLLAALQPAAVGTLFGALDLDLAVKGRGTDWKKANRNLTGAGGLNLADGRLVSPELVSGFAAFLQVPDLKEINFKTFKGAFEIVDGKLKIDSILLGSRFRLFPKGTIGLDGSLNLALDSRLSPETAAKIDRKGQVVRFLQDSDGWSQVPLLVSGSVTAPRFGLDPKGVSAQAGKAIGQELERQVDKLLRKQPPAENGDQPATEQVPKEKLIEDALRGLFGR
ncbi:MAG: AsmA family protein [Desulfuromonadales bacterium]|nr:AsmA family protein [Desulfuromonadales bacterium]